MSNPPRVPFSELEDTQPTYKRSKTGNFTSADILKLKRANLEMKKSLLEDEANKSGSQ